MCFTQGRNIQSMKRSRKGYGWLVSVGPISREPCDQELFRFPYLPVALSVFPQYLSRRTEFLLKDLKKAASLSACMLPRSLSMLASDALPFSFIRPPTNRFKHKFITSTPPLAQLLKWPLLSNPFAQTTSGLHPPK